MQQVTRATFFIARQMLQARSELDQSQERVALAAAISVHTYCRLETGVGRSTLDSVIRTMLTLNLPCLSLDGLHCTHDSPTAGPLIHPRPYGTEWGEGQRGTARP